MSKTIEELKSNISQVSLNCLDKIKTLELDFKKEISKLKATVHRSEADAYTWLEGLTE